MKAHAARGNVSSDPLAQRHSQLATWSWLDELQLPHDRPLSVDGDNLDPVDLNLREGRFAVERQIHDALARMRASYECSRNALKSENRFAVAGDS
jgi:hypothetical protein